ncbi:hypothetical protein OAL60_00595, partial [bacterium]|nr:hypothetical protein [bacterium]
MTQSIAYKSTVRPFVKSTPINSAANDPITSTGVRISMPLYIDLNNAQRKDLLNGVRVVISSGYSSRSTQTQSGLQVESASSSESEVESFLGLSIDNLRSVLFSRGGIPADLLFKLQAVAGLEFVSEKDLTAAF